MNTPGRTSVSDRMHRDGGATMLPPLACDHLQLAPPNPPSLRFAGMPVGRAS